MEHSDDLRPLTAQHDAIKDCVGRLVLVPIDFTKPGARVLDSGTGDGMHKILEAQSFPRTPSIVPWWQASISNKFD